MKKLLLIAALLCTFPAIAKKEKTLKEKKLSVIKKALKKDVRDYAQAEEVPHTNDPLKNILIQDLKMHFKQKLEEKITSLSHRYSLEDIRTVQLDLYEKYINRNQARA